MHTRPASYDFCHWLRNNTGAVLQEKVNMEPASLENLSVLHHSENYIVVNKHWDIRIDSKMWYEKQTVQSQLKHHFPELADPGTYYGFRSFPIWCILPHWGSYVAFYMWQVLYVCLYSSYILRFCHQLDFSTSGALCVALNKAAAGHAYRCFKERLVTKAYLALVLRPIQYFTDIVVRFSSCLLCTMCRFVALWRRKEWLWTLQLARTQQRARAIWCALKEQKVSILS